MTCPILDEAQNRLSSLRLRSKRRLNDGWRFNRFVSVLPFSTICCAKFVRGDRRVSRGDYQIFDLRLSESDIGFNSRKRSLNFRRRLITQPLGFARVTYWAFSTNYSPNFERSGTITFPQMLG